MHVGMSYTFFPNCSYCFTSYSVFVYSAGCFGMLWNIISTSNAVGFASICNVACDLFLHLCSCVSLCLFFSPQKLRPLRRINHMVSFLFRLYHIEVVGLLALWRVVLGRRKNIIKGRVESYDYSNAQLYLSTMFFTGLLFLLPTVLVYYAVFASVCRLFISFHCLKTL